MNLVIGILAITFDISEKLNDFLENKPPLHRIIIDYYSNFLLYHLTLLSNLIMFLVCLFFTMRMEAKNEIISIASLGYSKAQMFLPYLFVSSAIALLFTFLMNEVIPIVNRTRVNFEFEFIRSKHHFRKKNVYLKPSKNEYVFFAGYSTIEHIGYNVSIVKWEGNYLVERIDADICRWDTINFIWHLERVFIRKKKGSEYIINYMPKLDTTLSFTEKELGTNIFDIDRLPSSHLRELIRKRKEEGSPDVPFYEIKLYQRTSQPMSGPIFAFIGFLFATAPKKFKKGINIIMGLIVCLSYVFFERIFTVYTLNVGFNALISAGMPVLIVFLISLVLYFIVFKG